MDFNTQMLNKNVSQYELRSVRKPGEYLQSLFPYFVLFPVLGVLGWLVGSTVSADVPLELVAAGIFYSVLALTGLAGIMFWTKKYRTIWRERVILKSFAEANNLEYAFAVHEMDDYPSQSFKSKSIKKRITHRLRGENTSGLKYEFGNFERIVPSGRATRREGFGYIILKAERSLPNIYVSSLVPGYGPLIPENMNPISLEGNFDEKSRLYALQGQHIDALSLISPSEMSLILDHFSDLSIETINRNVIVYRNGGFDLISADTYERIRTLVSHLEKSFLR